MDAFNTVSLFGSGWGPIKFLFIMLGVIWFTIWVGMKEDK